MEVCVVCGKPATHVVQSIQETEPVNNWATWKMIPDTIRSGCDEHRQFASRRLLDGTIETLDGRLLWLEVVKKSLFIPNNLKP